MKKIIAKLRDFFVGRPTLDDAIVTGALFWVGLLFMKFYSIWWYNYQMEKTASTPWGNEVVEAVGLLPFAHIPNSFFEVTFGLLLVVGTVSFMQKIALGYQRNLRRSHTPFQVGDRVIWVRRNR